MLSVAIVVFFSVEIISQQILKISRKKETKKYTKHWYRKLKKNVGKNCLCMLLKICAQFNGPDGKLWLGLFSLTSHQSGTKPPKTQEPFPQTTSTCKPRFNTAGRRWQQETHGAPDDHLPCQGRQAGVVGQLELGPGAEGAARQPVAPRHQQRAVGQPAQGAPQEVQPAGQQGSGPRGWKCQPASTRAVDRTTLP